jgi:type III pantothenate kinase
MPGMTFLAIDVGNTRLKWALHAAPRRDAPILAQGVEFLENIEKLGEGDWARITPPRYDARLHRGRRRRANAGSRNRWSCGTCLRSWVVASESEAGLTQRL